MAKATLTRTQGYALTDTHKAVRESVDVLVTRTAIYQWDSHSEEWAATHTGLRVQHVKKQRWHARQHQFVACSCNKCF